MDHFRLADPIDPVRPNYTQAHALERGFESIERAGSPTPFENPRIGRFSEKCFLCRSRYLGR